MEKVLERVFFDRYYEVEYENEDYIMKLKYRLDENKNPIIPTNPEMSKEVVLLTLPKRSELPNLNCYIRSKAKKNQPEAWKFQVRRTKYEELAGETGSWGLARKTMEEINEIVEATYPGYGIINL